MLETLYLEDIEPGARWQSPARTVTESDIISFAGMTGDFDPLHVDHEFAAETPYGKPIAHGLLGLSFMAGLSSNYPRMRTLAFVRIEDWQFQKPIYVGDTIHAITEVESITPRGRRSGEVVWCRRLINQRGESVQSGRLVTLVSAQAFLPRSSTSAAARPEVPSPTSAKLEKLRHAAGG
jgi:acyl dehydratase